MKTPCLILFATTIALALGGCKQSGGDDDAETGGAAAGSHTHADGTTHDDHASEPGDADDHAHDEVEIGTASVGDMTVELAQGHGPVTAGAEGHLVVKLPYNDSGATVVRAWIGTEDRTLSMVGRGDYVSSHDDYDIHAMAPDPLPASVMWWIEVEKPDGTKAVGSARPILE